MLRARVDIRFSNPNIRKGPEMFQQQRGRGYLSPTRFTSCIAFSPLKGSWRLGRWWTS
jgi:hypothetical protein